jgi:hypothetical protein
MKHRVLNDIASEVVENKEGGVTEQVTVKLRGTDNPMSSVLPCVFLKELGIAQGSTLTSSPRL